MARYSGTQGSITWTEIGGLTATLNSWSLDAVRGVIDVTSYANSSDNAMEFISGMYSFSGSIAGFMDTDNAWDPATSFNTPDSDSVAITLVDGLSGATYSGSVHMTNFSTGSAIAQGVPFSATFQGTGKLTVTT